MRYIERSIPEYLRAVARPGSPSPAGGSVIGVVAALAAALAALVAQVSANHQASAARLPWSDLAVELEEMRTKLLNCAEEDVYDSAARQRQGEYTRNANTALSKIASHLLELLNLLARMKPYCDKRVASDLRAAAHLARAAVLAISEIEWDNAYLQQADSRQRKEIAGWRDESLRVARDILKGHTV